MALSHTYIIGGTGTGKSTLALSLMLERINDGLLFIDPHGEDSDALLGMIPAERRKDVIVFDLSDTAFPIPWNPLAASGEIPYVATSIVESIKDAWGYGDLTTPTMDQYIYYSIFCLIEAKEPLIGLKYMLTSERYRTDVLKHVSDPVILDFWQNDYTEMVPKERRDTTRSTLTKIGMLISDERIRNVIGRTKSAIDFHRIMSRRKILIVRLPIGKLGASKVKILGILLLTQLHLAALARTDDAPFHVFVDECHHFDGVTLREMLSGVRKFHVSLTLIHQNLDQLSKEMQSAILSNTFTKYVFKVSKADAEKLDELATNRYTKLFKLPRYHARIITGAQIAEECLNVELPPYDEEAVATIIARSRQLYAVDHTTVAGYIRRYLDRM